MSLRGDAICVETSSDNHFGGIPVLRTGSIHPDNQSRRDCFKTQTEQSHGDLGRSGGDSFAKRFHHCVVMPFALQQALTTIFWGSHCVENNSNRPWQPISPRFVQNPKLAIPRRFEPIRWRFLCREVVSLRGDALCIATSSDKHFVGLIVDRKSVV